MPTQTVSDTDLDGPEEVSAKHGDSIGRASSPCAHKQRERIEVIGDEVVVAVIWVIHYWVILLLFHAPHMYQRDGVDSVGGASLIVRYKSHSERAYSQ